MGFDPVALRFAIELLGAEHVLLGSDWPIMPIMTRRKVEETLATLDLTDAQRAAILGGNTRQLLTQQNTPQ
jgi:predicted TIM-barrel fold metal-dependent hydrolase